MTEASLEVWKQIIEAFPAYLPQQPITPCECEECLGVRAGLGQLRWNEILSEAIGQEFGSLPLLTEDAFHALLPAFLLPALSDLSDENHSLEWVLYALCGEYESDVNKTGVASQVDDPASRHSRILN